MTDLIVVADRTEARLYRTEEAGGVKRLVALEHLKRPAARLRPRELVSDRPGRVFARGRGDGGPASTRRAGTGGEFDPRDAELARFARALFKLVSIEQRRHAAGVVLVAGPQLLGVLRAQLPAGLRRAVKGEIRKDYLHASEPALLRILKRRV